MAVPGAVGDTPLATSDVKVGALDAYLARPVGDGTRGGVIVIHEAFGPVDHIADLARRFAAAGYDAIAPNLYTREGAPDPDDRPQVMEKMFGRPDAETVADLDACAAHLRSLDSSNGKVGVIGFCSGGRQTLLYASSSNGATAAVPCWGGFIDRATPDDVTTAARPTPVVDLASGVGCPILLVGGADDANPSPELLESLAATLTAAGKNVTLRIWQNAGHAFLADYRPTYVEGAAHELWAELIAFFGRHLA